jgi:MinD-like ATPase involved in chromosome partitioning or flagellar assembly
VRGLAFLAAAGQLSSALDDWWRTRVPAGSLPVLLVAHEPELETWVDGLDAVVIVGVATEAELDLYRGRRNVSATVVRDAPVDVTEYTIRLYGGPDEHCFLPGAAAEPAQAPEQERRPGNGSWTARPTRGLPSAEPDPTPHWDPIAAASSEPEPQDAQPQQAGSPGWVPDPFRSLAAARPVPRGSRPQPSPAPEPGAGPAGASWPQGSGPAAARTPRSAGRPTGHRRPFLGSLVGRAAGLYRGRSRDGRQELSRLALAHSHGKIVGVISRAGGVGKTAVAAAVGIIYGEAVEDSGASVAIVDQNVDNPDQWSRLDLDGRLRTVSEIMADIDAGREWSIPAWNRTPGLAVYPERRAPNGGYAPAAIERLAGQLRVLHLVSVIDLPNTLPAFTAGKAGVSAGWLRVADVVAIPTTDDPTRLRGVIELLETPLIKGDANNAYRSVPVIVAYVRSPLRAVREDRGVRRTLDEIRDRVVEVVEIPKDERATLAVVRGRPITEINPALRRAYVELSLAIARALSDS